MQLFHNREYPLAVVDKGAFGYFYVNGAWGKVVFFQNGSKFILNIALLGAHSRQIYRNRHRPGFNVIFLFPLLQVLTNLFKDKKVDICNIVAFFKKGNEKGGGEQASFRMTPAYKSLGSDKAAGTVICLGLEPHLKLLLLNGRFDVGQKLALLIFNGHHTFFIVGDIFLKAALYGFESQICLIAHRVGITVSFAKIVNSHVKLNGKGKIIRRKALIKIVIALLHRTSVIGAKTDEMVGVDVGGKAVLVVIPPHTCGKVFQQTIAYIISVNPVDVVEAVYIVSLNTVFSARIIFHPFLDPAV